MIRMLILLGGLWVSIAEGSEIVLQAFEGDGFDDWRVEGAAFGEAPASGKMEGMKDGFSGYVGKALASSAHGGASAQGALTSPEFKVSEDNVAFLIAGGNHPGKAAVQLLDGDEVVREATGRDSFQCRPVVWDVSALKGRKVRVRLIDAESGEWGVIAADHFLMTSNPGPRFPIQVADDGRRGNGLVAADAIPGVTIPDGSKLRVAAELAEQGVYSPTAMTFDERGALYVTETHRFRRGVEDNRSRLYWYLDDISSRKVEDRAAMLEKWRDKAPLDEMTAESEVVRRLSDQDEDGVFRTSEVFADGFNDQLDGTAAGVFAYDGTVYLANIPKIYALRDEDGDGKAEVREVVEEGFGVRYSFSGHDMNGFALSADGRIYGTIGDRGFHVETREGRVYSFPDQGAVFRFDPDGSNFEVIHTGLRNPKEIAFDEFNNGISVDNNSDQGDEARLVYVVEGADSGWAMEHQAMHSHHRQIGLAEKPINRWMAEKMWAPANDAQPAWLLPPVANITSGPSGLTYHPGTGFLERELGRFLICDYRGGAASSGIWSFRVLPKGGGMELGDSRRFNWGAAATDVEYTWDGRVMVTDFIGGWVSHDAGRVYELKADEVYRKDEAEQVARVIAEGLEQRPASELESFLDHPDQRLRVRAELALTRKAEGLEMLAAAAAEGGLMKRLHGLWGLAVIARRGAAALPTGSEIRAVDERRSVAREALVGYLSDDEPEIRAQAVKALGDAGLGAAGIDFARLIGDGSGRVKLFASIAAGKLRAVDALPAVREMLVANADADPYLRHAGAFALEKLATPDQLAAIEGGESESLRLAAVVALGRAGDPRVADFIGDSSGRVRDEAIRMVNDRPIEGAREKVAALLDEHGGPVRSQMMWRRLLNSAYRLGDGKNLHRVVGAALEEGVPLPVRREAFRLLQVWTKPHEVDQSLGRMMPLPERDAALARECLQRRVGELLHVEDGLLEAAFGVMEAHDLELDGVPDDVWQAMAADEELPGEARARALDLYTAREPEGLDEFLVELSGTSDDAIALESIRLLVQGGAPQAVAAVGGALESGSARRKQEAWMLAADMKDEAVAGMFVEGLEDLIVEQGRDPAAIELVEGASKRDEPEVAEALKKFQEAMAESENPLAPYQVTLLGGDVVQGRKIFESHPAAQCMRCHVVQRGHSAVGNAGPNLFGVATRGDRNFLLESLIVPGAKVAPGFGVVAATLNDGTVVGGILVGEDEKQIVIDVAGEKQEVARAEIKSVTEPVSAMPPMGVLMSRKEIRDVVAWLASLDRK